MRTPIGTFLSLHFLSPSPVAYHLLFFYQGCWDPWCSRGERNCRAVVPATNIILDIHNDPQTLFKVQHSSLHVIYVRIIMHSSNPLASHCSYIVIAIVLLSCSIRFFSCSQSTFVILDTLALPSAFIIIRILAIYFIQLLLNCVLQASK